MALPFAFAAVTSATGQNLDDDFNAVGNMGTFPCTVSGSNAITMTPAAGITPSVATLTNYMRFSGVVAITNTTGITIQIGSLGALVGYKDSVSGPVALSGGELVAGNAFTATYDSALNTGAGGFHIVFGTAFAGGTIAGNVVLSGGYFAALGGSLGATLTSALLSGNSLTVSALRVNATYGSLSTATLTNLFGASGSLSLASITSLTGTYGSLSTATLANLFGTNGSLALATITSLSGTNGSLATATIASLNAVSASITSLSVGASASPLLRMISGLGTLTFSVTSANAVQDQTIVLPGAQIHDSVALGIGVSLPSGAGFSGFIAATGTVTMRLINPTAATLGAATLTVRATALGFT